MKFTLSWLKKFLDTKATLSEISHCLTMIGLEVEDIYDHSIALSAFEIAQIVSTEKHPNADKLQICQVATGDGTSQIVCGASNARAGIKVVLAKVGTIIPNGDFKIKKASIRGVESNGMLCSVDELGIGTDSEGIMELAEDAQIGSSFVEYQGLNDPVIHINITPNRADALGVYGIARDLAAAGIGTLKKLSIPQNKISFKTDSEIKITDYNNCSLFSLREFTNLNNSKTPKWLSNLLENIGIASVSPVVDITNYISYSFGQPMHAYDADKVDKNFSVITLSESQKFTALNNKEYDLPADSTVIGNNKDVYCLAGIIGGSTSACTDKTSRIILEAACFNPDTVAKTGRKLQINTDSRYRFERNVDREFTLSAMEYATAMILEICGGEASDIILDGDKTLPQKSIEFSSEFLASRIGFSIEIDEICNILEQLGFTCTLINSNSSKIVQVTVPSWRYDVSIKEDLVEEIIRIHGYDQIPEIPLPNEEINRIIPKNKRRVSEIKRILAVRGYNEVVSWSFTDSKIAEMFGDLNDNLFIQNPISSDLNYMRSSILPNLCKMAKLNMNRDFNSLSIFEAGPIFENPNNVEVITHATGIRFGNIIDKNYFDPQRKFDIYDIKADIKEILAISNIDIDKCQIKDDAPDYYHPTRSASVYLGKNLLASFGQINPAILQKMDINTEICAFEININKLPSGKDKFGMKNDFITSNYQSVTRDFAFIVDKDVKVGEIINAIRYLDRKTIKNVNLFDVYTGNNVDANKKSIAISVEIQDDSKTLTEEDLKSLSTKIIDAAYNQFNAILRDN